MAQDRPKSPLSFANSYGDLATRIAPISAFLDSHALPHIS